MSKKPTPKRKTQPDELRLLHKRPHHNYTDDPRLAAAGEPEAVDETTQNHISNAGRQADHARHDRDQERSLTDDRDQLTRRLAELRQIARSRNVDVDADVRVIERRLDEIQRKIKRAA
jgi:hypothetical protein